MRVCCPRTNAKAIQSIYHEPEQMHQSNYNLDIKKNNKSNFVNGEVTEYIITYHETEFKIRVLKILRIMCVMEQIHVNVLIFQRRE